MYRFVERLIKVEKEEFGALLASAGYFFFVLSAYYVIRPVRDEMGAAGGIDNLSWLFTATVIVMFLVNPAFSALVSRLGRYQFIRNTYRFFGSNLLIFYALMRLLPLESQVWVGRMFYVWTAVFNLFVVSIFWAFMADIWHTTQSKRLFGFIGVGGTIGGIVGSTLTAFLAEVVGVPSLLVISAILLEAALFMVRSLPRLAGTMRSDLSMRGGGGAQISSEGTEAERPIGGSFMAGVTHVLRSPYLLMISAFIMLYTITNTVLYFQKLDIVSTAFTDRAVRTAFFAKVDLAVNVTTVLIQVFLTGRIIRALGVGLTLGLLPIISIFGFAGLGLVPAWGLNTTLYFLVIFESLRRAGNYSLARPARETLFTVVDREDKYKAKAFIDTFVYRFGDVLAAWSYDGFLLVGLAASGIAFATVPLAGLWLMVGLWLGKRQGVIALQKGIADTASQGLG